MDMLDDNAQGEIPFFFLFFPPLLQADQRMACAFTGTVRAENLLEFRSSFGVSACFLPMVSGKNCN